MPKIGVCDCCGRTTALTFHHLIPRKVHRRAHFKKHYTRETLAQGILICRQCHSGIHKAYNEMTLAKALNSLELLKQDDTLRMHFLWVSKQKVNPNA